MTDSNALEALTASSPAPRNLVRRMPEYHPPLGSRDGLRLDFNENTLACSPRVTEALHAITASDLTKYPVREPVEKLVAGSLGLRPEEVLLTNGVDEAIHVICQAFLDRGDELLFPVPTYAMYRIYGSATEAVVKTIAPEPDFRFPAESLMGAITARTKVIMIANPNSPMGTVASRGQIVAVLEKAPHAVVLIDEAYYHFYGETVIDLVGRAPNLIVARTFSKAYGLAAMRLGLLAASAGISQWLRRVVSPYSVNAPALAALTAAIRDPAYLDWYAGEIKAARATMAARLDQLGVPRWPSEANFILVRIGPKHAEFVSAMHRRAILTRDRSRDEGCDGCVRITVGTREQTSQALDAIEQCLQEIQWR